MSTDGLAVAVAVRMTKRMSGHVKRIAALRQPQLATVHKHAVLASSATCGLALCLRRNMRCGGSSSRFRVLICKIKIKQDLCSLESNQS